MVESYELSNESMLIRDTISRYTRLKKQEKLSNSKEDSNLLRFLEFNSSKASKWTLLELFQRLEKWMSNLKDPRFLDSQRLRQNLERTCSSIEETNLTRSIARTIVAEEKSCLVKMKT
jgi:Asp-tRNA(Asn)/Glu-tRNA(Gln) amidotransferase B subunit